LLHVIIILIGLFLCSCNNYVVYKLTVYNFTIKWCLVNVKRCTEHKVHYIHIIITIYNGWIYACNQWYRLKINYINSQLIDQWWWGGGTGYFWWQNHHAPLKPYYYRLYTYNVWPNLWLINVYTLFILRIH